MNLKRKLLWIACPLVLALLLVSVTILAIAENVEPPEPSVSIEKFNLSFEKTIYIKYAVKLNEADAEELGSENFRLLFWTAPHATYEKGTENSSVSVMGQTTIGGVKHYTFAYTELAAKQMVDTVYARAYVNVDGTVYYSDVEKYSIVQYAYDVFHSETATQGLKTLVTEMLSYGAAAQDYFNYNESRPANGEFLQIEVTNGTLEDGFTKGLYLKNETVTVTAPETDENGLPFSHWKNSAGENISTDRTATLTVGETEETYTAVYDTPYEDFTFTELNDGTYSIAAKDVNNIPANVVIPSTYNGKAVTSIGRDAFEYCTGLTSITIPNSVTSIGRSAFYGCTGLTSITIPSSVTSIGVFAFYNCNSLATVYYYGGTAKDWASVSIDSSYDGNRYLINKATIYYYSETQPTTAGNYWYYDENGDLAIWEPIQPTSSEYFTFTELSAGTYSIVAKDVNNMPANVIIPSTYNGKAVTSIGRDAFKYCTGLTSINIPNSVTSIGWSAFYGCTGLTSIMIPNSIMIINEYAFQDCTRLTSITIPSSVTVIGGEAFYNCTGLTSITIPSSVTSIGFYAFYGCTGLTSITFAENSQLTIIGASAFYNCTGLTSITIPSSVTSIDSKAFYGCTGLTSITVESGNTKYHSVENCLIKTASQELVLGCKNSVIPTNGSVKFIGESAFRDCTGLTSITIPSSVTIIGESAFRDCTGLTSITFAENSQLTSIGSYAFEACTGLTSVTFAENSQLTSIGYRVFYNCTGLTSITIPNSVTSIGDSAFRDCTGLTSITFAENSQLTSIGSYAFEACTGLTSVTFAENSQLTSIGYRVFYNCTGLTSITIPNSVTSIDYYAFKGCTGLTTVYYSGTAEAWAKISINSYDENLTNATIYYYSETQPTTTGNYWYYDENGVPTVW